MNVLDLLTADLVLPALEGRNKESVMHALAERVAGRHRDIEPTRLVDALRQRERLASTALADGIAVPHARLPGLTQMVGALARSHAGIDFDSHDGGPTHLFFLLVGPPDQPGAHLRALASVSRLLHDPRCRAGLMAAEDAPSMLAVLREHARHVAPAA